MAEGLLALFSKKPALGKGGDSKPGKEPMMPDEGGGAEQTMAGEAFDALKDDDREGFVSAFIAAVEACVKKEKDEGYAPDEDDAA